MTLPSEYFRSAVKQGGSLSLLMVSPPVMRSLSVSGEAVPVSLPALVPVLPAQDPEQVSPVPVPVQDPVSVPVSLRVLSLSERKQGTTAGDKSFSCVP